MPRRSAATIRPVEPDARHRNRLVQQVINKIMQDGKKSLAERIVYDSLAIVGEKSGEDPVEALEAAIKALTPVLEVRSRREYSMADRLAAEIVDATQQQGSAWKRKDDIYRMAQANKAFAHYRW